MSELELKVGRVYRAKKPRFVGFFQYYNDRQIRWIAQDGSRVQYDSPSVANGRHFPSIERDKFLAWAGRDVTSELPDGEWERKP